MKNYFGILFLCIGFALSSCKKEATHIPDLLIAEKTYFVAEGKEISIPIGTGSGQYELVSDDTTRIKTTVDVSGMIGYIRVKGLLKGETKLMIKDQISGQSIELPIQIVDPFLIMRADHALEVVRIADPALEKEIRKELEDFKPFNINELLILKKNAENDFFLLKDQAAMKAGTVLEKGHFDLSFYYGGPNRLRLEYLGAGRDTLDAAIFSSEHGFIRLFDFVWGDRYYGELKALAGSGKEIRAEQPITINNNIRLVFDLTEHFRVKYPQVRVVELFQELTLMPVDFHPEVGGDLLK